MSRGIAGLVGAAGARANRALGSAKGSMLGVKQVAIEGKYRAEAQQRAHEHFGASLDKVHGLAGSGSNIHLNVSHTGDHSVNYTKAHIGEGLASAQESQAIKNFKAKNAEKNPEEPKQVTNEASLYPPKSSDEDVHDAEIVHEGPTSGSEAFQKFKELAAPKKALPPAPAKSTRSMRNDRVIPGSAPKRDENGAVPAGPARKDMTPAQKAADTRRKNKRSSNPSESYPL